MNGFAAGVKATTGLGAEAVTALRAAALATELGHPPTEWHVGIELAQALAVVGSDDAAAAVAEGARRRTVRSVADLLRFVLGVAGDRHARDRFRAAPEAVLEAGVDRAAELTGEDVEAAVAWARDRLAGVAAERMRLTGSVRPVGAETPLDAAHRTLLELCDELDGPPAEVVTLPHREVAPAPPPPATIARGGGQPVPRQPPGRRWLHPVVPDDDQP